MVRRDIVFAVRDRGHSKKTRTAELPNWVLWKNVDRKELHRLENCVLMFSLRLKSHSPTGLDLGDQLEDWDTALEALRDKEIWKHKGAEGYGLVGLGMRRSRSDKTVGGEKGAEDARWTGKGQAREWDRESGAGGGRQEAKGGSGDCLAEERRVFGDFGKALG